MSSVVHRPGSLEAEFSGQSTVQDIRWEVSQSNLNLVATKEALEKHGVRMERGLQDVGRGIEDVGQRLDGIDRTLVEGVVTLHTDLMSIEGHVSDLTAKFDWAIVRLEAGIGGLRDSLEDLIRLAKTPEQTWAIEQYGIACDAFDRNLYPESLEHIQHAINGFEGHTGYKLEHRFHHRLAMILRAGSEVQDLAKAEDAYLTAARYAGERNKFDGAVALAAAGIVAYEKGKIDDALAHTKRALTLANISEVQFQMAKFLMHRHDVHSALQHLDKAIEADPLYSVKCLDRKQVEFLEHEQEVRSAITRWRDALAEKCGTMDKDAVDAALHLKTIANTCQDAIRANINRLAVGRRFKLRATPFPIGDDTSQIASTARISDAPYLVVRDYFERRQQRYELIAASSEPLLAHIASAQSALADGMKKPAAWAMDGGAQLITVFLAAAPIVFWLVFYRPATEQEMMGTVIVFGVLLLSGIGTFALGGTWLATDRAWRVNKFAEKLNASLTEARASVERRIRRFASLLSSFGSVSPHAYLQMVAAQPDVGIPLASEPPALRGSEANRRLVGQCVKYGSLPALMIIWIIYYNSPTQVATRKEDTRLAGIALQQQEQQRERQRQLDEQKRQAEFERQQDRARRSMTNPVRVLDPDSALAALQKAPFALPKGGAWVTGGVDPGSMPVFSKQNNRKHASEPAFFIDPVLVPIMWTDPTYEDASQLITKQGYRGADAYELVSYVLHVGLGNFSGACIVATGTLVVDGRTSPMICKDPKEPRLLARWVPWAAPGQGNYQHMNAVAHVLAIKQ